MLQSDLKPQEELLVATTQFKKLACSGANCSQLTIVMMKQRQSEALISDTELKHLNAMSH